MIVVAESTRGRWLSHPIGAEIDVAREMMRTTFDIVLATMLSVPSGGDTAVVEQAITDYLESTSWVMALTILGGPRWVPYPGRWKARRGRDYLKQLVGDWVSQAGHARSLETIYGRS
jgi:cytochrome P450